MAPQEAVRARIQIERLGPRRLERTLLTACDVLADGNLRQRAQEAPPGTRIGGAQLLDLTSEKALVLPASEEQVERVEERRRGPARALDPGVKRHGQRR